MPRGAIVGSFFGGMVVGGISSPFWWPFYAVPVPVGYYDPYYAYPSYAAPQYVLVVPPPDATTARLNRYLQLHLPTNVMLLRLTRVGT